VSGRRGPRDRRAALRLGLHAEVVAALFLRLKGYRILDRRFMAGGGEIDIVALRGSTIVFVEVKLRADLDAAAEAIGGVKRRRIARAVAYWRTRHPWSSSRALRGDALLMAPWRWPRHVEDAFPLEP
jgi:putative endonuclease